MSLSHESIDAPPEPGEPELFQAARLGDHAAVRALIAAGADPNACCPRHRCGEEECERVDEPLVFHALDAAHEADGKLAALLRAGARLDVTDREGLSPLERAKMNLREEREASDAPADPPTARCVRILREASGRGPG